MAILVEVLALILVGRVEVLAIQESVAQLPNRWTLGAGFLYTARPIFFFQTLYQLP
jgi:hypothetical protein